MTVFRGGRFQRGYGLGSFFQSLARRALPFLQKGAQSLGRAALKAGTDITQDVLMGKNLRESAQSRLQQTAKNLKEQALNRIIHQSGSGRKPLKQKTSRKKLSSTQAVKGKRTKTTSQKKRKAAQIRGVVKKSKITHLKDIWGK